MSWNKEKRKWRAFATIDKSYKYIGSFTNEEEAARAFDTAMVKEGSPAVNFSASKQNNPPKKKKPRHTTGRNSNSSCPPGMSKTRRSPGKDANKTTNDRNPSSAAQQIKKLKTNGRGSSRYMGVYWNESAKAFQAQINFPPTDAHPSGHKYLGGFGGDEEKAVSHHAP